MSIIPFWRYEAGDLFYIFACKLMQTMDNDNRYNLQAEYDAFHAKYPVGEYRLCYWAFSCSTDMAIWIAIQHLQFAVTTFLH